MPASSTRELAIRISAVNEASAALKQAGRDVDDLSRKGQVGGGLGSSLKSLKQFSGEESELGNIAKILQGAGAVAGFSLLSRSVEELTGGILDFTRSLHDSTVTAGDLFVKFAGGIPIVGSLIKASDNLANTFLEIIAGPLAHPELEADRERRKHAKGIDDALGSIEEQMDALAEGVRRRTEGLGKDSFEQERQRLFNERDDALKKFDELSAKRTDAGALDSRFAKRLDLLGAFDPLFSDVDRRAKEAFEKGIGSAIKSGVKQFGDFLNDAKKQADETAAAREVARRAIAEATIKDLDAQADAGNKLAGIEADRLRRAEDLRREHDELLKLSQNELLTDEQRKQLASQAGSIEDRIAGVLGGAEDRKRGGGGAPARLASLEDSRAGSGIIARLRSDLELNAGGDSPTAIAKRTNETLDKLPDRIVKPIVAGFRDSVRELARGGTPTAAGAQVYSGT